MVRGQSALQRQVYFFHEIKKTLVISNMASHIMLETTTHFSEIS